MLPAIGRLFFRMIVDFERATRSKSTGINRKRNRSETLVILRSKRAIGAPVRETHQRRKAPARSRPLPLQRRRRYETLGRPRVTADNLINIGHIIANRALAAQTAPETQAAG